MQDWETFVIGFIVVIPQMDDPLIDHAIGGIKILTNILLVLHAPAIHLTLIPEGMEREWVRDETLEGFVRTLCSEIHSVSD